MKNKPMLCSLVCGAGAGLMALFASKLTTISGLIAFGFGGFLFVYALLQQIRAKQTKNSSDHTD